MSEITELSSKLASEGEKLVSFFNTLTDDHWNAVIYTEGTILELPKIHINGGQHV